ncbi:MAG: ATP-binding protein [Alphaproteobacteria bacterium]|nr:ATP-binding protein [Alphaproteobacteria bacterium]
MLETLKLRDVGPAPHLEVQLGERLNFLVGDNGLGKSFLLDVAWWVLTGSWARGLVSPHPPPCEPEISYSTRQRNKAAAGTCTFDRRREVWSRPTSSNHPLVIYAQVDGGFSVCDPSRDLLPGLFGSFTPGEVWEGNDRCEGLIRDWASWQREDGEAFAQLIRVLRALSPSPDELLIPGDLRRISLEDPKHHPTLRMPYGQDIALIHASAGMRRVVALAYLLVWTWREHLEAAKLVLDTPVREVVFLIDEVEAHLHPEWQRRIVPALLNVMEALTGDHDVAVQLIAATHSPLVLMSTESLFDPGVDAIWELDLVGREVRMTKAPWRRRGDANAWLTSSAFDLREPRSVEAEEAMRAALEVLRDPRPDLAEVVRVDELLRDALGDDDRFWVRWSAYRKSLASDG